MKVRVYQLNTRLKFAPLAWAIKFIQKIGFSHYAFGFANTVVDSTGHGVREHNEVEFFTKKYRIYNFYDIELNCTLSELKEWYTPLLGRKYSAMQLVGFLLVYLKIKKTNPFGNDSNSLICSELVILMLVKFKGLEISDSDDYDLVKTDIILKGLSI